MTLIQEILWLDALPFKSLYGVLQLENLPLLEKLLLL